jgi:hypothetical protein
MYAEIEPPDAKTGQAKPPVALFPTPGLDAFGEASGKNAVRGAIVMGGVQYEVIDNGFYSVAADGTKTNLGTLITADGRVSMAKDFNEVGIVDGSRAYAYDTTNGFRTITDSDLVASREIFWQDGYWFFINNNNTGQVQFTTTLTSMDPLDFFTAEGNPDGLIAGISDHREIWLFGENTVEVWWNAGAADIPFARIEGSFIERGIGAQFSRVKIDNTVFWLGEDKIIYRAAQYTPQRVSTHAIEREIRSFSTVSDASAFEYTANGHKFYVITFPTGGTTFVYDTSTKLWHKWEYWNTTTSKYEPHLAWVKSEAYGKTLLGARESGKTWALNTETYTDAGDTIRRLMTAPQIQNLQEQGIISRLQIDFEAGVGLNTGQGSDPQAVLDWSDDGGQTWSNTYSKAIGKIGRYGVRSVWKRLGRYQKGRVFRCYISDPINPVVMGSYMSYTEGSDGD